MRVHVREPEDRSGYEDEHGDVTGLVWKGLRSRYNNGKHENRPVDEAAEPLAERRPADPRGALTSQVPRQ
jgi:hypothetical protein